MTHFVKFFFILLVVSLFVSCTKTDTSNNPSGIPYAKVNLQISLAEPTYSKLQYNNNFVYINNEGVRGIVVINNNGTYYAFERNCPFHPQDQCATVMVKPGTLQIHCGSQKSSAFESCCTSQYNFDGSILQGPASLPLLVYPSTYNNGILYINN
jgi:nitrite reductase/ring-hydroxylating ferredoxin subunit